MNPTQNQLKNEIRKAQFINEIIKKSNPDSSLSTSFKVDSAREGASCTAESLESQQFNTQGEHNFFSSRNSVASVPDFSLSQEHPLFNSHLPEDFYWEINDNYTWNILLDSIKLKQNGR